MEFIKGNKGIPIIDKVNNKFKFSLVKSFKYSFYQVLKFERITKDDKLVGTYTNSIA